MNLTSMAVFLVLMGLGKGEFRFRMSILSLFILKHTLLFKWAPLFNVFLFSMSNSFSFPQTFSKTHSSQLETSSTQHTQQPWQMIRICAMSSLTCSNVQTSWPMRWGHSLSAFMLHSHEQQPSTNINWLQPKTNVVPTKKSKWSFVQHWHVFW